MEIERILKANCDAHSLVAVQPQGEYWVWPRDPTLPVLTNLADTSPPCPMHAEPLRDPAEERQPSLAALSALGILHPQTRPYALRTFIAPCGMALHPHHCTLDRLLPKP